MTGSLLATWKSTPACYGDVMLNTAPILSILLLATASMGQWSDDASINTLVSGEDAGCVISHAASTSTGDTWIAWYDSSSGYDVSIQRLDANGTPVFEAPVLVSDQSLSWVQDFDLACVGGDNAALAWSDGAATYAVMIALDGSVAWEHQFGGGGGYTANAQICRGDDTRTIIGWGVDSDSHFQAIATNGMPAWFTELVISDGGTLIVSDLHSSGDEHVIASFVSYTSFSGPKRLKAARISTAGTVTWGLTNVFTSSSLQYGAFPEFISDDSGGAVLSWYTSSPLMIFVQWIDADGTVLLGSNGLALTTESSMAHVSPAACHDPINDEVTVFWARQNSGQSQSGVQVNRVNRSGNRLLGATGEQVMPLSSSLSVLDLSAAQVNELAAATWVSASVTGVGTVLAAAADPNGNLPWNTVFGPTSIGTPSISRQDLSATSHDGQLIACWSDTRDGSQRIYAQNIHTDGTLGGTPCPADFDGDGAVGVNDLLMLIAAWGTSDPVIDITGDGHVDTDDLLALLSQWGPCA